MKYRKKPVVVDAELYRHGQGLEDGYMPTVAVPGPTAQLAWRALAGGSREHPYTNTLEGLRMIGDGDYIITGVEGERYPCKPSIFLKTYELVE